MSATGRPSASRLARRLRRREHDIYQRFIRQLSRDPRIAPSLDLDETAARVIGTMLNRVQLGEARDFAASMPEELGLLLESYLDRAEEPETFDRNAYLEKLAYALGVGTNEADTIAEAVLRAMNRWLPLFEVDDVESNLPADLRELWRKPSERTESRPRGVVGMRAMRRRLAGGAARARASAAFGPRLVLVAVAAVVIVGVTLLGRRRSRLR